MNRSKYSTCAPRCSSISISRKDEFFPDIIGVFLIGKTDKQYSITILALAELLVKRARQGIDHIVGHRGVDLARKLNKIGKEPELLSFSGKVEKIDGNAVAT
jgi:hypothetical protein